MSELDQAWATALSEAEARARATGRAYLSEYLSLRGANDLSRKVGADWLLGTFARLADDERWSAKLTTTSEDNHRFKIENSTMVGRLLKIERGVRKLLVEVGWPRTPRDGIIRGGGLACANIKHVGMKSNSEELRLIVDPEGTPQWIVPIDDKDFRELHESDLRRHLLILLNDSPKGS